MKRVALLLLSGLISFSAWSLPADPADDDDVVEFDPSAPDAMQTLKDFDQAYRAQTGEDTLFDFANPFSGLVQNLSSCVRFSCHIYADVAKDQNPLQMLYLYIDGKLDRSWPVSTAKPGHVTPDYDGHPSGPFYSGYYNSKKYPGGDWHGLGNMPYATFYDGGFAIHGTPSISQLGHPASHGCVRSHPDNAHYFSQLVIATGRMGVWVTVAHEPVSPESAPISLH